GFFCLSYKCSTGESCRPSLVQTFHSSPRWRLHCDSTKHPMWAATPFRPQLALDATAKANSYFICLCRFRVFRLCFFPILLLFYFCSVIFLNPVSGTSPSESTDPLPSIAAEPFHEQAIKLKVPRDKLTLNFKHLNLDFWLITDEATGEKKRKVDMWFSSRKTTAASHCSIVSTSLSGSAE
ncbi:60S ribosomal protein L9, partial [Striga asiatica]